MEKEPSQRGFEPGTLVILFDLPARRFDQPAVLDARRTRRFTGTAIQAQVNVPHKAFAERQSPALHLNHLVDSPARRVHFDSQLAISRAAIQAKAAVNAFGIEIPGRSLSGTVAVLSFQSYGFRFNWIHYFRLIEPAIG